MNKLIETQLRLCLLVVITGVLFLANPLAGFAGKPPVEGPTRGSISSTDGKLQAIQARAKAVAAKLNFKSPKALKEAQAELASVHADFVAYAKTNGLKLSTKTYTHPVGAIAEEQSCPGEKNDGKMNCILSSATVYEGHLICYYSCIVVPEKKQ